LRRTFWATGCASSWPKALWKCNPRLRAGSRNCYVLTEKGERPKGVVVALAQWGERFTIAPDEIPQAAGVAVAAESPRDERVSASWR
jgi:hypothetical protein